jgi:uncharacterized protein
MLLVPTFLGLSKIEAVAAENGLGLFAARRILKGEAVWKFDERTDRLLTVATVEGMPQPAKEFVYRYGCQCREDLWLLCGDNARFVNHGVPGVMACNLGDHMDSEDIALCDIGEGEEITEDYRRFALDFQRRGFYRG